MKKLFQIIRALACATSLLLMAGMTGCAGGNTKDETSEHTIAADSVDTAAKTADCNVDPMDPCKFQETPMCCRAISDCDSLTDDCIKALLTQHKIDEAKPAEVKKFTKRINSEAYNFTPKTIDSIINGIPCNDKFVMRMFDSSDGFSYMIIRSLHTPTPITGARTFPVSLISYIMNKTPKDITEFEFYVLKSPETCTEDEHESILMKVIREKKSEYYDVSVPPDYTKDAALMAELTELTTKQRAILDVVYQGAAANKRFNQR